MIDVVVAYDRTAAKLLEQIEYSDDAPAAFAKRLELELAYRDRPDVEVVLLGAATFGDLKISHARYFDPQSISATKVEQLSRDMLERRAS
jgi:hypothetical protein